MHKVGFDKIMEGPRKAATQANDEAKRLAREAQMQSNRMQSLSLLQPRVTMSDNFMANKLKNLASLRLGINSTISTPTVNPVKSRLGV